MLVIRRRPGESLFVGDDVEIEVVECGPHKVKLGIRAPRSVAITRSEVRQTSVQNLAAARSVQDAIGTIAPVAGDVDGDAPALLAAILGAVRP